MLPFNTSAAAQNNVAGTRHLKSDYESFTIYLKQESQLITEPLSDN